MLGSEDFYVFRRLDVECILAWRCSPGCVHAWRVAENLPPLRDCLREWLFKRYPERKAVFNLAEAIELMSAHPRTTPYRSRSAPPVVRKRAT